MNRKNSPGDAAVIRPDRMDYRIAAAVGICMLTAHFWPTLQVMTACICVLLCTQEGLKNSWRAGTVRLLITAVGGLCAVLVICLDERIGNAYIFILLAMAGVLLTLLGCRLARVPYVSARIGAVTFILVILTKPGMERISYALLRLWSTLFGVAAVMAVEGILQLTMTGGKERRKTR